MLKTTKVIIFATLEGVAVVNPAMEAWGCTLNEIGETMLAPFPEERAKFLARIEGLLKAPDVDKIKSPFPGTDIKILRAETEDEFLARIQGKDVPPDAKHVQVLDLSELPEPANDMPFRGAWRTEGQGVFVDMPAARNIIRADLRHMRERMWPSLDAAVTAALAKGDQAAAQVAEARRQRARDLPASPQLEEAKTPAELKALVFEI